MFCQTLGAQVAQLVEQGTENPRVGGSIPSLGTISLHRARDLVTSEPLSTRPAPR